MKMWHKIESDTTIFALGELNLDDKTVSDIVSTVTRLKNGSWNWRVKSCYPFGDFFGNEPNKDHAIKTAEKCIALCWNRADSINEERDEKKA